MRKLLFAALIALASFITSEARTDENYEIFKKAIHATAQNFGIRGSVTVNLVPKKLETGDGHAEAWIDERSTAGSYIINVANEFLNEGWSPRSIKHIAVHEVCHIKNGDVEHRDRDKTQKEYAAERCAYLYLGQNEFAEHYIEVVRKKNKMEDFIRETFRSWARIHYGQN
jgi:hypothetical protein